MLARSPGFWVNIFDLLLLESSYPQLKETPLGACWSVIAASLYAACTKPTTVKLFTSPPAQRRIEQLKTYLQDYLSSGMNLVVMGSVTLSGTPQYGLFFIVRFREHHLNKLLKFYYSRNKELF